MSDLVSGNLKEEKELTRLNYCTWGALGVAGQLVESIRKKAEPCVLSSTFGGKQAQTEPWAAVIRLDCWRKIAISNNVGGVKRFLSTLLHALKEERHFALVGGLRFPTWARF